MGVKVRKPLHQKLRESAEKEEMWFVLAREFGQDPWEMQQRWTMRQFLVAVAWYRSQFNTPSRSDYYLMQLTAAVAKSGSKSGGSVKLSKYKIDFDRSVPLSEKGLTKEQISAVSKSIWLSRMTMPVVRVTVTRQDS